MKNISIIAIILSLFSLTFVSCQENDTLVVTDLAFGRAEIPVALGWTMGLRNDLNVTPFFATHQMITWSSGDPDLATVNDYGLVTANPDVEGRVTITARIEHSGHEAQTVVNVFRMTPPTVETIVDYEGYPFVDAVANFLDAEGIFAITKMSPRLQALVDAYTAVVPELLDILIAMPYGPPFISATSSARRTFAVLFNYEYVTTYRVWPFGPVGLDDAPLVREERDSIAPDGTVIHNPNSDILFQLRRFDRTSSSIVHSSSPRAFALNAGLAPRPGLLDAVHALFTPLPEGAELPSWTGGTGTLTNFPAPDEGETQNFIGFMNSPYGHRIFQDGESFWFRSKRDPNDWFFAELQP
ncbi:MAG: Ig-like domain-containing protein [Bacteroidales bacterium]|nr:Ig-like domain-containing protein [Bacteroidales bacterium]